MPSRDRGRLTVNILSVSRIVLCLPLSIGGCNDCALLGALRDSWYDGYNRPFITFLRRLSQKFGGIGNYS